MDATLVSIFDQAFRIASETKDRGDLLRLEPLPLMGPPWEAPAQWRIGTATFDELKAEAWRKNHLAVPARAEGMTLLGYPLVVDEAAEPALMILELIP